MEMMNAFFFHLGGDAAFFTVCLEIKAGAVCVACGVWVYVDL